MSGNLASFNSSLMKTTLKIENAKEHSNNRSLGNILEELDGSDQNDSVKTGKTRNKRNSLSNKPKGKMKSSGFKLGRNGEKRKLSSSMNPNKNNEKFGQLPVLSEKSNSKNNEIKIKEESITSNNFIEEEKYSNASNKMNTLIKPKVIRIKSIIDKRKTNKVFQSMEGVLNKNETIISENKRIINPKPSK